MANCDVTLPDFCCITLRENLYVRLVGITLHYAILTELCYVTGITLN